jgi:CheY-like chemotaxis protein
MLERLGFTALTAVDGLEALKVYEEHRGTIRCVLLDLTMPRMDGEETFRELRRMDPGLPVILCSGYNEQETISRFVGEGLAGFIQKPYRIANVREALKAALGS